MKVSKTNRGFDIVNFTDHYGVECSLQQSSLATEEAVWLGCNDADPKIMVHGLGWYPIQLPNGYTANTRMHLTRDQVAELLPHLNKFVETGEI